MFLFITNDESYEFCEEIVEEMINVFGITKQEAIERLNAHWKSEILDDEHIIHHETVEFWARDICYGHSSLWWQNEEKAKILPLD